MPVSKKVKRMQRIYAESLNGVDDVVTKLRKTVRDLTAKVKKLEDENATLRRYEWDLRDQIRALKERPTHDSGETAAIRRHRDTLEHRLVVLSRNKKFARALAELDLYRLEPRREWPADNKQQETDR